VGKAAAIVGYQADGVHQAKLRGGHMLDCEQLYEDVQGIVKALSCWHDALGDLAVAFQGLGHYGVSS
jgi:hypothetical protein